MSTSGKSGFIEFSCHFCGVIASRPTGHVNRSRKNGLNLYCGRSCAGKSRRSDLSEQEKKSRKAEYDAEYRQINKARIKRNKAAYYQRTRDPVKEAENRKARMRLHVEYCRRPEYRKWKREYDRQYRAKKEYGEFADCFLLAQELRQECLSQASDYEIRQEAGTSSKSAKRKRAYEQSHSNRAEIGALGHIE